MIAIRKTENGKRWEVVGCPAAYGSNDSNQSPVVPPTFKTRAAAVEFANRVIGRGEAKAYTVN